MAEVTVLPLADYATGSHSFGPVAVPDAVRSLTFRVDRCTAATPAVWPNESTTLVVTVECQIDGGEWREWAGMGAPGGIVKDKFGNDAVHSSLGGVLPAGSNRSIRGSVAIAAGPLRSSLSVEIL